MNKRLRLRDKVKCYVSQHTTASALGLGLFQLDGFSNPLLLWEQEFFRTALGGLKFVLIDMKHFNIVAA